MAGNPSKRLSSSITLHYDVSSALLAAGLLPVLAASPKKLRRMPHLFNRVLELPLDSESPVEIQESLECFTFTIRVPGLDPEDVRAEVVEIVPGVSKVCILGAERLRAILDELDLPPWRFRLPSGSQLHDTSATYDDDMLVVRVPKDSVPAVDDRISNRPPSDAEREEGKNQVKAVDDTDSADESTRGADHLLVNVAPAIPNDNEIGQSVAEATELACLMKSRLTRLHSSRFSLVNFDTACQDPERFFVPQRHAMSQPSLLHRSADYLQELVW